ncbi:phenoloxidase-activating factor 2 isoform X1 [Folsomia candida]|uniref:phenoloxidase-activating factor 2 isoform X1 n=1 Tax=Folsomia candida TaxID=158441 RepID=UPI0016050887|nr:phenoloxidase-activating factor 2 isoform X1 [Folsomia candida]
MTGCHSKRLFVLFLFLGNQVCRIVGQGLIIVTPVPAIVTPGQCQCTPATNCADGGSAVDPRVLNNPAFPVCTPPNRFCCNLISTTPPIVVTPPTCGTQPLIPFPAYTVGAGQASYSEYPWMVVVLGTDNSYIGGGVLIDGNTVLTVAHKVTPLTVGLKVRLGEYILNAVNEPNPAVEIAVTTIRIHEQYQVANLQNDIAVLKLASSVDFNANPHIRPICLPALGASFAGQRCWVSGFGASSFVNGVYSTVMREVDLPVLDGPTCQTRMQTTRLGAGFILNQQAFLCAGGEPGKDSCTGDGGSPLVCQVGTQWFLAGLVSWGIGCGVNTIPGVYTNIPNYIGWITTNRV